MTTVTKDQLGKIAKAIVIVANPYLVIMFGSQSRGTANINSDIDLLIIGDRPSDAPWSRRPTVGEIRRSLPPIKIPIDILFFTPEELERWKGTTNHVIREALNAGAILYERP
ncbi:MAG: nucleotidyltransferase domain-containing protein [Pyrinomonadaceae bacterium]